MNALDDIERAALVGSEALATELPLSLPDELPPVDRMPLGVLPTAFRAWVGDVAERMQVPVELVAVPLLVGASSLVARRLAVRPKRRDEWTERGNLWANLVAPPGMMKSPAMAAALEPMKRLEARAAEQWHREHEAYELRLRAAKLRREASEAEARKLLREDRKTDVSSYLAEGIDELPPPRPRYVINDATYEKLGAILVENPDGVLVERDELRGLLLSLEGEEAAPARGFYLSGWSGGPYTFDRIGRGTLTIPDVRLSIIGAIQPGPLMEQKARSRRGAADDGLLERFLICWPDPPRNWRNVDRFKDSAAKQATWDAFEWLDRFDPADLHAEVETWPDGNAKGLPFLRLADEAREPFDEWLERLQSGLSGDRFEGMEGAMAKFRHHVPALALTLHVVDRRAGPIGVDAVVRALALAEFFESHARRLHLAGRTLTVKAAKAILNRVRAGDLGEDFRARDVHRKGWSGLTDTIAVDEALGLLVDRRWLTETDVPSGERGGRPTTIYRLTEGARHG